MAQSRQTLVARELTLQLTGFGQVVEQNQLARFADERACRQGNATAAAQRHLMVVVFTWGKTVANQIAPKLAFQRLTKQITRRRVGFAHHTPAIQHHYATGQQVQYILQTPSQSRFFRQLMCTLLFGIGQLALKHGNLLRQQRVRLRQLLRDLTKTLISIRQRLSLRS